jgi:glutamate carboxypeptidase
VPSYRAVCERESEWLSKVVKELVACESPSIDRAALEKCADLLAARLTAAGASVRRLPGAPTANHVLAEWPGNGPTVLLLGHFDTVWPVGQLARMPIREEQGRLFGPGVFDMKAGLALGILAVRALQSHPPGGVMPRVRFLATSDEEVGSGTSRATIERLARASAAVLVLEPSLPGGALKTARKGVGEFEIVAHGVSAHAGVDPDAGASAVHELARQITAIEALADRSRGLSVNVGVIDGGTRPNVVAERAHAVIDVRIARLEDAALVTSAFEQIRAVDPRVRLEVRGGINRPPMERSEGVARLYAVARDVAQEMGADLGEGATGGGSDGNFTAALGVPTLDGLGAVGDGPHALHEHILINELPWRAALVAGILARLGAVG